MSETPSLRVAICTAEVGAGHSRAAMAVAGALKDRRPDWTFEWIDALANAPRWFTRMYRDGYLAFVNRVPRFVGLMYRVSDKAKARPLNRSLGCKGESLALRRFLADPRVTEADLIVCTHFLCARVLSSMRSKRLLRGKLAVVITDQHPHAVWRVPNADLYLVATDRAAKVLANAGIDPSCVCVSGIPIDPAFGQPMSADAARGRHGLEHNVPLALITGGGLGLGGLDQALEGFLKNTRSGHAVVVCGANTTLKDQLDAMMKDHPAKARVKIIGMTNKMHELMAAADVLVGKAGGLTTSEALARGLPMVLLKPIPGQEERNATALVDGGAAELVLDPFAAGERAATLLSEIGTLRALKAAAQSMGRPDATQVVAQAILQLASENRASGGSASPMGAPLLAAS